MYQKIHAYIHTVTQDVCFFLICTYGIWISLYIKALPLVSATCCGGESYASSSSGASKGKVKFHPRTGHEGPSGGADV